MHHVIHNYMWVYKYSTPSADLRYVDHIDWKTNNPAHLLHIIFNLAEHSNGVKYIRLHYFE